MIIISKPIAATVRPTLKFRERPSSVIQRSQPRVKRSATLDGGCVIDHQGYSVGDRELSIEAMLDKTTADDLFLLVQESTFLILSGPDGSYYGAVSSIQIDNGDLRLSFLAKEAA